MEGARTQWEVAALDSTGRRDCRVVEAVTIADAITLAWHQRGWGSDQFVRARVHRQGAPDIFADEDALELAGQPSFGEGDIVPPCDWQGGADLMTCAVCGALHAMTTPDAPPCGAGAEIARLRAALAQGSAQP